MIDESLRLLASEGANFGVLTTLMPDGSFQSQVIWVDADSDHILINTEVDRQKHLNVRRDPRATVTVIDAANPYHYVEARGRVVGEVTGERARAHIDELSMRYTQSPYNPDAIKTERVILQILPEKLHRNG